MDYLKPILRTTYNKTKKTLSNSYSPYSKYKVAAGFYLKKHNKIITGTNVENASYGATICAERSAIVSAISQFGKCTFDHLIVITKESKPVPPCALCLQVLAEFCKPNFPIYLANDKKIFHKYLLKDLLPVPFNSFTV